MIKTAVLILTDRPGCEVGGVLREAEEFLPNPLRVWGGRIAPELFVPNAFSSLKNAK
jgi:hypothetical protein